MIEVSESRGRRAGPRRGLLGAVATLATVAGSLVVAQPASALPLTNLTVFTSTPQALSLLVTYNANGDDNFGRYLVTADGTDADTLPDSTCEDLTADVGNPDTCTISGLTADQPYTITLEARATGTDAVLLTRTIAAGASTTPTRPSPPAAAPTAAATGVSGQVKVSWVPTPNPAQANVGAILAPYTATAYVGSGTTVAGTCTSTSIHTNNCLINGLTNDNLYTFTVVANGAGTTGNSLPSARSLAAGPGLSPAAPTNAVATVSGAGLGLATVSWTAPTTGTTVASYTVKGFADGVADATFDCTATAPTTTCTPLGGTVAPSTVYTFTVTATGTNGVESATASAGPAIVVPAQIPDVPVTPTVTGGDTQATVTWAAPAAGAAVSLYRVTATAPGPVTHTCTTTALTCTLTGLTNGTVYTTTVASVGGSGNVSAEEVTAPVNITPAAVPKPVTPTGVTATPTDTTIEVAWATPAANPTVPVVYYTATATPGDKSCATVSGAVYGCTITGLTPETDYTVTVVAKAANSSSVGATATATTTATTPDDGGAGPGDPTGPIVVNPDGKEQIFTRGGGASALLWTAVKNAESGMWEEWTSLGGPLYSDPVPVRNSDGKLQVFVLDASGFVTYKLQGADGEFGAWKRISVDRSIAKIVAATNADGKVQIFGRSGINLFTAVQTTGADAWSAWVDLGYPVSGDPTVAAMADGSLEVFTAGHQGAIYRRAQTAPNSTTWSSWVRVAPAAAASEFM